jgi:hypothetical protein
LLTSSTTRCIRVPRHVARLVTRLVTPLVLDYIDYAARPGASACRAARHAACRAAHRRLLRLHRASGCLGMSRGSSSTTSTTPRVRVPRHVARLVTRLVSPLVIDYCAYFARPGASARRAAGRRLLRLRHASGCLGASRGLSRRSLSTTLPTSHGSSCGSSSTTSTTLRVWVPRHVTRLVTQLVSPLIVDYFAYAARPGASARCVTRHAARRRLLRTS